MTERKRGEEDLCRALARAVEAQQNTAAIVNSVHEGMLVIDAAGTLQLANPAALRMLRCSAEEILGQTSFPTTNWRHGGERRCSAMKRVNPSIAP